MNDNSTPRKGIGLIVSGVSIVAILVVLLIVFLIDNGVTNNGNKKQETLVVLYNDTTNVLSDCLVRTKQSIGAAQAQTDALDQVITNAVRGRYEEGSSAQPGSSNALFSAISEAYPDTKGLSKGFENALIIIDGCRVDFKNTQAKLQRGVASFNQWRTGSWTVRTFGDNYPTDDLEIEVNGNPVTGKDALRQMRRLVVVEDAQTGRDTNRIENDNPFETGGQPNP